ncbi:SDR family NAD(P)-dependent oxidoreductase [Falsiroseomonas tokyonensis]|uniref:SDR family NAD(P)-dependent oxidoreductase n=1 Tax=Falsiroseomonas tokyonensis TaxID=430521 RepID=A0ABV7C050_9PROT|nr:SDR family NAD(P)-dependent oxidoreductase [Falsiroseomonas tokyonensis]MBU8540633.1 SDR family NAD(P)-dependent oxidoreductase [Falsiroseomonas tokyonensis]
MSAPVCAVVGFGPGLGAAVARRFAAGGFAVLGLCRDPARHAALPKQTAVMVYNAYRASFAAPGPSALAPADLAADFAVNVTGALVAVQAVLPGMRAAGQGSILFTGGGLALDPTGWLPAASLAVGKAGLRSLALTLHAELASQTIHAGTVTIAGTVARHTAFDPDRIAEAFWDLHADPAGAFQPEIIFRG